MALPRTLLPFLAAATAACSGGGPTGTPAPRPPVDTASARPVAVWVTTGDRARLLASASLDFAAGTPAGEFTLTVDTAQQFQSMVGFGAAFTDASTWLIQTKMSAAQRDVLMRDLFSPAEGIGLSFMRMTMGSSDFSREHWSYDDVPAGQTDDALAHFSIQRDREAMLPVIQQARQLNPDLRIMASPWSPPGWMKTTGSMIKGRLRTEAYPAYAQYFRRFIEAYAAEGVPIYALSVNNEPHFEPDNYPGMRMEPAERAAFVGRHLGPVLEGAGIQTLILDWDHNWDEPNSPLAALADPVAARYIDGVAWHCYGGDVGAQSAVHDAHPTKDTFFTECSGGEWAPAFADNLKWLASTLIVGTTRNWARGVAFWNLALDPNHGPHLGGCGDCRGVVTITATGAAQRNEEYYALAHASKFVRPGARRVGSNSGAGGLEDVAFLNPDGSKVLIVVNTAPLERSFAVRAGSRGFSYSLPAGAVATFRWR